MAEQDIRIPLNENEIIPQDIRIPLYDVPPEGDFSTMYPDSNIPKPPTKKLSYADEVKRKLGIIARGATIPATGAYIGGRVGGPYGAIIGAGGLTTAELATMGLNLIPGVNIPSPLESAKNLLPFPKPETLGERTLETAVEAASGVRPSAKAFQTLAKESTGLKSRIYETLGLTPTQQAGVSGLAGGVSAYKTETTGDPMEGLKYGLASSLPFALTSGRASIGPTAKEIKTAASSLYKSATESGVIFKQNSFKDLSNNLRSRLGKDIGEELLEKTDKGLYKIPTGLTESTVTSNPKTIRYLNQLKLNEGKNLNLDNLQTIRSNISRDIMKASDNDARTLRIIRDAIDDFVDTADISVLKVGPMATQKAKIASQELKKAKELWRQGSRAEVLQDINQSALLKSGRSRKDVTQLVIDNLESITKRKDYNKMFSASERTAIEDVIKGGDASKFFRTIERNLGGATAPTITGLTAPGIAQLVPESLQPYVYGATVIPPILSKTSSAIAGNLEQRGVSALEDLLKLGRQPTLTESMLANVINPALISGRGVTGSAQGFSGILGEM